MAEDKTDKHFHLQPGEVQIIYYSQTCYETLKNEHSQYYAREENNTCKQANHVMGSISVAVITLLLRASTTRFPRKDSLINTKR